MGAIAWAAPSRAGQSAQLPELPPRRHHRLARRRDDELQSSRSRSTILFLVLGLIGHAVPGGRRRALGVAGDDRDRRHVQPAAPLPSISCPFRRSTARTCSCTCFRRTLAMRYRRSSRASSLLVLFALVSFAGERVRDPDLARIPPIARRADVTCAALRPRGPVSATLAMSDSGTAVVRRRAAGFSGPLDLLLTLIREEQVDIYDIPIARICEQFVARIRTLGSNEAAEYLEMAARLLRIKAQMLLPRSDDDEAVGRSARRARAPAARVPTDARGRRRARAARRRAAQPVRARAICRSRAAPPQAPLALSLSELLAAVDRVLRASKQPNMHDVIPRAIDIPGAITIIRSVLALAGTRPVDATSSPRTPSRGRFSRRCSACSSSRSSASSGSCSPNHSPTWRSLRDAASEAA